jgi:ABC-type transport system involved in cytochrome bd biosynthesis fused ATPase/permease subunit
VKLQFHVKLKAILVLTVVFALIPLTFLLILVNAQQITPELTVKNLSHVHKLLVKTLEHVPTLQIFFLTHVLAHKHIPVSTVKQKFHVLFLEILVKMQVYALTQ